MLVACAHYVNAKRMAMVLDKVASRDDVKLLTVRGTVVRSNQTTRCIGNECEYVVLPAEGAPLLFSNNPEHAKYDKKTLDYNLNSDVRDNLYVQLLLLCANKYSTSSNPFAMVCSVKGVALEVTPSGEQLMMKFKAPQGDSLLGVDAPRQELFSECKGIRSFTYTVTTDSCDKEVSIKRGQIEIMREVAHYLNKALLFVSFDGRSVTRELCVTATGCCEAVNTRSGRRIVKVPYNKVEIDPLACVIAIDASLDSIVRSGSFNVVKD